MRTRVKRTMLGGVALAAMAVLATPGYAFAASTDGTAALTGGDLTMSTPATVEFAATLSGTDQTTGADQSLTVMDHTGSGAGWNVSLSATQFTFTPDPDNAPETFYTLPSDAVSLQSHDAGTCATTCVLADDTAAASAPFTVYDTPTLILNASPDFGLGDQTWINTMSLKIPGDTRAGTYSSTWTYSLESAP